MHFSSIFTLSTCPRKKQVFDLPILIRMFVFLHLIFKSLNILLRLWRVYTVAILAPHRFLFSGGELRRLFSPLVSQKTFDYCIYHNCSEFLVRENVESIVYVENCQSGLPSKRFGILCMNLLNLVASKLYSRTYISSEFLNFSVEKCENLCGCGRSREGHSGWSQVACWR